MRTVVKMRHTVENGCVPHVFYAIICFFILQHVFYVTIWINKLSEDI